MATTMTAILNNALSHIACLKTSTLNKCFITPSISEACTDLFSYFQMGIPASLLMLLNWGLLELFVIFSGYLGVVSNGSYVLLNMIHSQATFLCAGLSAGLQVCTGNSMGENKPKTAQKYVRVVLVLSLILNGLLASLLLIF
mmetsp:Transcript_21532/g.20686  ORF Transcript_21532/g.20686 Transcript_21532/m.20686 type:complete len:142 (+) Transcript_21532:277-702(+)